MVHTPQVSKGAVALLEAFPALPNTTDTKRRMHNTTEARMLISCATIIKCDN